MAIFGGENEIMAGVGLGQAQVYDVSKLGDFGASAKKKREEEQRGLMDQGVISVNEAFIKHKPYLLQQSRDYSKEWRDGIKAGKYNDDTWRLDMLQKGQYILGAVEDSKRFNQEFSQKQQLIAKDPNAYDLDSKNRIAGIYDKDRSGVKDPADMLISDYKDLQLNPAPVVPKITYGAILDSFKPTYSEIESLDPSGKTYETVKAGLVKKSAANLATQLGQTDPYNQQHFIENTQRANPDKKITDLNSAALAYTENATEYKKSIRESSKGSAEGRKQGEELGDWNLYAGTLESDAGAIDVGDYLTQISIIPKEGREATVLKEDLQKVYDKTATVVPVPNKLAKADVVFSEGGIEYKGKPNKIVQGANGKQYVEFVLNVADNKGAMSEFAQLIKMSPEELAKLGATTNEDGELVISDKNKVITKVVEYDDAMQVTLQTKSDGNFTPQKVEAAIKTSEQTPKYEELSEVNKRNIDNKLKQNPKMSKEEIIKQAVAAGLIK